MTAGQRIYLITFYTLIIFYYTILYICKHLDQEFIMYSKSKGGSKGSKGSKKGGKNGKK